MRYFFDTEFSDTGKVIDLISIGIVDEEGREFYAISEEFDRSLVNAWVQANVIPKLEPPGPLWKPRATIRDEIVSFVADAEPEFWAYNAAYDWVALCQLFGPLTAIPANWPRFVRDLREWVARLDVTPLEETEDPHHALADARYNRRMFDYLASYEPGADSTRNVPR
ncbi:MAG TPA: 3'-5' exoribonuclease [Actinomycetota bacterium]|nr:3'-5' exoribonuclease [Actinomycetota bacterium]